MQINPSSAATRTETATAAPAAASGDAAVPQTDFQTFLALLTAQMKNQDPLKPMESTEFVAQLASFSSVEQQVRTNERLDRMLEALGVGSGAGVAQWIGREVRAPVAANFQGVPVEVEVAPRAEADRAVLVVENAAGQEVARRTLEKGQNVVTWDGLNAVGNTVANGRYSFAVESYKGEELLGTDPGQVYAEVSEVRLADGAAVLILDSGERVVLDDVTGVR